MARTGKSLSFNVAVELADRGTRRNVGNNRHGWEIGDFTVTDISLAAQATRSLVLPTKALYIATNADNIVLDYIRGASTTSFKLKNIIFLSDFESVTALVLRNTGATGTPIEMVKLYSA